ncbi:MAG: copper amine oxidase N-terminal domain-containing protein [Tissierellia bacterium]|nr:copper amine oxidase N-terminal domain-containing protein [Tissierellia bacterium]
MMKKFASLCTVAFALLLIPVLAHGAAAPDVKIYLNGMDLGGSQYGPEVVAPIRDGRTFLILEQLEKLGYEVSSEGDAIEVKAGETTVAMTLEQTTCLVNGEEQTLEVAPFKLRYHWAQEDFVYVPIRFIQESFGKFIHWDGENRVVIIGGPEALEGESEGYTSLDSLGIQLKLPEGFVLEELGEVAVIRVKNHGGENPPIVIFRVGGAPTDDLRPLVSYREGGTYIFAEEQLSDFDEATREAYREMMKSIKLK